LQRLQSLEIYIFTINLFKFEKKSYIGLQISSILFYSQNVGCEGYCLM